MKRGRPSGQPMDGLIQGYFAGQWPGARLVESEGRVYDRLCSACGFDLRFWDEDRWACGRCEAKWGYEDRVVPKGKVGRRSKTRGMVTHAVPAPRASDFGNHLAEYAGFGYALNQMLGEDYWKFPTQILVGYATTGADYAEIADHANQHDWPSRSGKDWTAEMARDWAKNARRELARRIAEPDRIAC